MIESELEVRLSKAFQEIEARSECGPRRSGQVHRAVLRNGRPVAIKVKRPNIRERVREDLKVLGEIAEVPRPPHGRRQTSALRRDPDV